MKEITDPHYSIKFNPYIWSEEEASSLLVYEIWNDLISAFPEKFIYSGQRQPITPSKDQLKVLLLNLFYAFRIDPDLCIGIGLRNSDYSPSCRYNTLGLSSKLIDLVHALRELGYLDWHDHVFIEMNSKKNIRTRIRASDALIDIFAKFELDMESIEIARNQECIELRTKKYENAFGVNSKAKPIAYIDTDVTDEMRTVVKAYNELLNANRIDVSIYPDQRYGQMLPNGQVIDIPIVQGQHFVRRIFSRGSFDFGGRFYGGFWQQIPKEDRPYIRINGEETVELDFSALHPRLLAAEKGMTIEGDPYHLGVDLLPEHLMYLHRKYVKKLLLVAINAKDRNDAYHALVGSLPGELAKHYSKDMLKEGLQAIRYRHPFVAGSLCSDAGIRLMRTDSNIVEHVLKRFIALETPVLPVHDSFVVQANKRLTLENAMREASKAVTGVVLDFTAPADDENPKVGHYELWKTSQAEGHRGAHV